MVYESGHLLYVGSTSNLRKRLSLHREEVSSIHHQKKGRVFSGRTLKYSHVSIKFRVCRRFGEWLAVAYRLIYRLCPSMNKPRGANASVRVHTARSPERRRHTGMPDEKRSRELVRLEKQIARLKMRKKQPAKKKKVVARPKAPKFIKTLMRRPARLSGVKSLDTR